MTSAMVLLMLQRTIQDWLSQNRPKKVATLHNSAYITVTTIDAYHEIFAKITADGTRVTVEYQYHSPDPYIRSLPITEAIDLNNPNFFPVLFNRLYMCTLEPLASLL